MKEVTVYFEADEDAEKFVREIRAHSVSTVPASSVMGAIPTDYRFADLQWQSRWNSALESFYLTRVGRILSATGFMGTIRIDLANDADIAGFLEKGRRFLAAIESSKKQFDVIMSSWAEED